MHVFPVPDPWGVVTAAVSDVKHVGFDERSGLKGGGITRVTVDRCDESVVG